MFCYFSLRKLPWSTWRLILNESITLQYYMIFDHAKATAILEEDERILAALEEQIKKEEEEKEKQRQKNEDTGIVAVNQEAKVRKDLDQLIEKLKAIASPQFIEGAQKIKGIEDVVKFAKEHRGTIFCINNVLQMYFPCHGVTNN